MPTLVHKHVPDTTLVVSDDVAESMKGSWDIKPEKPAKAEPKKK